MEQLDPYYQEKEKRCYKELKCLWFIIKITVIALVLFFAAKGAWGQPTEKEFEQLLDAIAQVESNCNDLATGDSGKAIGRYQIHKSYWIDGTAYLKVSWPYSDARDAVKARQVVRAYLARYATKKRLGRTPTLEDMVRIHNGGPDGYKKASTKKYWIKVKNVLDNCKK